MKQKDDYEAEGERGRSSLYEPKYICQKRTKRKRTLTPLYEKMSKSKMTGNTGKEKNRRSESQNDITSPRLKKTHHREYEKKLSHKSSMKNLTSPRHNAKSPRRNINGTQKNLSSTKKNNKKVKE